MRYRICACALIGLFGVPPAAAAPGARTHTRAIRRLEKEATLYWNRFQKAFNDAYLAFREPYVLADAKAEEHPEAVYDYAKMRELYEEYAAIERLRGEAAKKFAQTGGEKSLPILLKQLFGAIREIEKVEKELAKSKPIQGNALFDQRPAVLRYGLALRRRALVEALASAKGAPVFLSTTALDSARRKDGSRSAERRISILDALAVLKHPDAREAIVKQLVAINSSVRIAALEALSGYAPKDATELISLVNDSAPPVRRALYQTLAKRLQPKAIPDLVYSLTKEEGATLHDVVRALHANTRQTFGTDHTAWKAWLEEYRKDIEEDRFDLEKVEIQEAKPAEPKEQVALYGVSSWSRNVIFLVEGSLNVLLPAEVAVQKKKYWRLWRGAANWKDRNPSHKMVLQQEMERTLKSLPTGAQFALVTYHSDFSIRSGPGKLVPAKAKHVKKALKRVKSLPGRGWCSQFAALLEAFRLAGLDPEKNHFGKDTNADTVYLVDAGSPSGGRAMLPEAALAAFHRLNRFRRVTVHTLRICNEKEEAVRFMKGLAEESGGTYTWLETPPKP